MNPNSVVVADANESCCPAIPTILHFSGPAPFEAKVYLKARQFGEAYHVLISRLLLEHWPAPVIGMVFGEGTSQLQELFQWYNLQQLPGRTSAMNRSSKSIATSAIAATFRSFNSRTTEDFHQDVLFESIRKHLDPDEQPVSRVARPSEPETVYRKPSDVAQEWLNRYFAITNSRLPRHAKELPKTSDVRRFAVIHVRRASEKADRQITGPTSIGFIMDDKNLKDVASSIQSANKACAAGHRTVPFTHVMLFGDLTWFKGRKMANALQEVLGGEVEVLFVSRPWEPDDDGGDKDINRLWEEFRAPSSDNLPIQVKILGIWTALCELYHPKVCVIGFRSGFVETAGFIGIPIFYLNNDQAKAAKKTQGDGKKVRGATKKKPEDAGDRLWKKIENPTQDRLREVSDVLNTFIPVEALKKEEDSNKIARVEEGYEDELMGALFMFMCCEFTTENGSLSDFGEPGWTGRIAMMYDTCEDLDHDPGPESDQCDDKKHFREPLGVSQTGQEWLRRRYSFAVKIRAQGKKPDIRLDRWHRVDVRRWVSIPSFPQHNLASLNWCRLPSYVIS